MIDIFDKRERNLVIIGFVISLFHWALCAAYFAILALYMVNQGIQGPLKTLLIVTVRCLLSTVVATPASGIVQMEKWAIIVGMSFLIISRSRYYEMPKGVRPFRITLTIFAVYAVFSSFLTSGYPTVSIFKVISYAVPFYAIAKGVAVTDNECNWIHYMKQVLTPIILACILTIPFQGRFNIVNGTFQGILNHPNLMGIFLSIFIGCFLFDHAENAHHDKIFLAILALCFYMLYATASRTGMLSAVISLVIYWYGLPSYKKKSAFGWILLGGTATALFMVIFPSNGIVDAMNSFLFKRHETRLSQLFDSRQILFEVTQYKHSQHPWIGSGFGVPYNWGAVDWALNMNMTYETGNLYYTLLGDTGYIGFGLFIIYMVAILFNTEKKKLVLFSLPLIISMGEMAFFSTNNIAILYYFFYGICLSGKTETQQELIYQESES